jgi:hypothetical protein
VKINVFTGLTWPREPKVVQKVLATEQSVRKILWNSLIGNSRDMPEEIYGTACVNENAN